MIGARTVISGTLRVLSPLHIGSGRKGKLEAGPASENPDSEFSTGFVLMDDNGLPYIPGSSLKGVLRRLSAEPAILFGPESGRETPASGKVIFWTAFHRSGAAVRGRIPYGDARQNGRVRTNRESDLFIESQTAIDGGTGVAERSRLFHNEQILPGTEFAFRITLKAKLGTEAEDAAAKVDLAAILGKLCAPEGVGFGRNTRQGNGRLRLLLETVTEEHFSLRGPIKLAIPFWPTKIATATRAEASGWACKLTLRGTGPFLIADSTPRPKAPPGEARQIVGLADFANGGARLTGASLLGALRAKFFWEQALRSPEETDDRDKSFTTLDALSTTERLFGVTGWRGRVSLEGIKLIGAPKLQKIMSVRLDRFSGAPIDNALFGTEAWVDPRFEVSLALEGRKGLSEDEQILLKDDDKHFLDFLELLKDPLWGGLQLGLGQNKGYGVFAVEVFHV